MNKLKNLPNINYITLTESFERRKYLYDQFSQYGIFNLVPHVFEKFKRENFIIKGKLIDKTLDSLLGTGTSHLKAIKNWLDTTTEPYGFFCEDDISLETVQYWNFTWLEFIKSLPKNWDCIQLGVLQEQLTEVNFRERNIYDWSILSYIITRDYAKKIIDNHYNGLEFNFDVIGYDLPPSPEHIIYLNEGSVFSFPLFVENINFESANTPKEQHPETYNNHKKSYEHVISWWKNTGKNLTIKNIVQNVKKTKNIYDNFAHDTEDAELNFELALHYHDLNQTASAFSHYYRCAERTTDEALKYECLLRCYQCFISQTNRDFTALHCLKQAICLLPERPEGYFLIAKHYEDRKEWYDCYTYCCIALKLCKFDLPSLKTWVGYPGKYSLLFQKAVAGWWWDKTDETYDILTNLLIDYPDLPAEYKNVINNNLKNFFKTPEYRYSLPNEITQTKNIVDCFSFYSGYGKEMLELRYNILKDYVDYFVLCELNMTHTGKLIKQEAAKIIDELGLPKEKFIIINLNLPVEENLEIQEIDRLNCMCGNDENKDSLYSRVRERLQKDAILQIYDNFNNDTVFIHSDLDEIINPRYLTWFADQARKNPNILIKVPLVYLQGRADLRTYFKDTDTPAPWDDNLFLCLKSHLQHTGPTQIRSNKFTPFSKAYITQNNEIVQDAGWHFSWMGDSNTKKIKQQSFIHYTDKFDFVVGGSYNNTDLENILNTEDLENHIPPSGEKDKVLKKYNVNFLPDEIFKLDKVKNFLLPNYSNINFLENLQDILKSIYGFCSVKKATVLTDLIIKHNLQLIVEIGVLEGSSFIPQALALKQNGFGRAYAIDPWSQEESLQYTKDENHRNYWGTVNHNTFYNNFVKHIETYNVGSFVEVYKTTSKEASKNFLPYSIDLLHVDGNHSEEQSYEDVCLYLPLVRKGGFVVFDDLHWTDNGKKTTQKAAKYLQQHCAEIEQVTDELGNFFVIFQKK